jgi:hypothetical protein
MGLKEHSELLSLSWEFFLKRKATSRAFDKFLYSLVAGLN